MRLKIDQELFEIAQEIKYLFSTVINDAPSSRGKLQV